jgi:hypothetical protein
MLIARRRQRREMTGCVSREILGRDARKKRRDKAARQFAGTLRGKCCLLNQFALFLPVTSENAVSFHSDPWLRLIRTVTISVSGNDSLAESAAEIAVPDVSGDC